MAAKFPQKAMAYFLLAPTILICLLFLYYPTGRTVSLTFYKVAFFGLKKIYVGSDNFKELFTSADYLQSVLVSFIFTGASIVLSMTISLVLAILLNQKVRGIGIYVIAIIWPYTLSFAVAGTIWSYLFNPAVGMINYLLESLFRIKPDWISIGPLALIMIIVTTTWKSLGYNVIFFLAALQHIPRELLEAANVDGANDLQRFWKIILPLLTPTIFFLLVMNSIHCFFTSYGMISIMTEGGPAGATNIMVYKLVHDGFNMFKTGYASAQSLILFVIVVAFTLIQFRVAGRRVHYGGA